jgi:hypothetical protein
VTLVAAYESLGMPILLGDFMISGSEERIRGRKKISRPRKNLVIGWTGNLLQATNCIEQLLLHIGEEPSKRELEDALATIELEVGLGEVRLVGWHSEAEEGQEGFHWDSSTEVLAWGREWYVGSGGASFETGVAKYRAPLQGDAGSNVRKPLKQLVELLAFLNCGDRLTAQGHEMGVGGGYEALNWSQEHQEFRYVDRSLFFVVVARISPAAKVEGPSWIPMDTLITYEGGVAGDTTVLTISEGEGREIWALTAIGDPGHRDELIAYLDEKASQSMDLEANFYASMLAFVAPHAPCPAVPIVITPWDNPRLCAGTRGQLDFRISEATIENAYRKRRAEYEQAPVDLLHISGLGPR